MRVHLAILGLLLFGIVTVAAANCTKTYVNFAGSSKTLICQTCCYSGTCKTTCW
jgi:hypothetical protein